MPKLGNRLFNETPLWFTKTFARRFAKEAYEIYIDDPDVSLDGLGVALLNFSEPHSLSIGEPISTSMSWAPSSYLKTGGGSAEYYLHEARIPFSGTPELWRVRGQVSRSFSTRVSFTQEYVRLRLLLADRDAEHFREVVEAELSWAREIAANQGGSFKAIYAFMCSAVDQFVRATDLGGIRDAALIYKARSDRASARLLMG